MKNKQHITALLLAAILTGNVLISCNQNAPADETSSGENQAVSETQN